MKIQAGTLDESQILTPAGANGIIIVQKDIELYAVCAECESIIHWSWGDERWFCTEPSCDKTFEIQELDEDLLDETMDEIDNSVLEFADKNALDIATWVSRWLNVPLSDVRVSLS